MAISAPSEAQLVLMVKSVPLSVKVNPYGA